MSTDTLRDVLAGYRRAHAHRFRRDHDWLRLSILASVLLAFSILAFAQAFAPGATFFQDAPGSLATFAGAAIILFIGKIGRTEIYADWMVSGATYVGVGLSLLVGETHGEMSSQIPFSALLMASGVVRIWIGLTIEPRATAAWLYSSGCIAFMGGLVTFGAWASETPLSSLSILAVDLLFLAISIAGFSFSLQDAQRVRGKSSRPSEYQHPSNRHRQD
ncbi:hypothetical protein [Bradyrhizobium sp. I1.14.4]|uniref:hypothetical protein n=1 Tax=unclassified Bradyrhizobium TaxID=2631580 RepID=UPI003D1F58ED